MMDSKLGKIALPKNFIIKLRLKAQSAMEYLMTYGWAILTIAVVLAALFSMGIFKGTTLSSQSCVAQPGYLCSSPLLNTSGNLRILFSEVGSTITITGLNCTSGPTPSSFVPADMQLLSGQQTLLTFNCPLTSNSVGSAFAGSLYIQYNSGPYSGLVAKVASVTAKVSTQGTVTTSTTTSTSTTSTSTTSTSTTSTSTTSTSTSSTSTTSTSTTTTIVPSSIVYYAQLTITNSQSSATPQGFQQMVSLSESSFSSYIAYNSNFANFEFFYSNGTIVPAWIESNQSGTLTIWLKINPSIAASSSYNGIFIGFASTSTNLLSSSGTSGIGEAPQLSCPNPSNTISCSTYAEYDDGAEVFNNYWNFAGTSLPSSLTEAQSYGSVTINNGVNIKGGTTKTGGENGIYTSSSISPNVVLDYYGTQSASPSGDSWGWNEGGFSSYVGSSDWHPFAGGTYTLLDIEGSPNGATGPELIETNQGGTVTNQEVTPPSTYLFPASIWTYIYTSSTFYVYQNYTTGFGYVNGASNSALPFLIMVGNNEASYVPGGMTVYWLRTRAYPPNGVMPSVSFGSVVQT